MSRNSRYKETILRDKKGERTIRINCPIDKTERVISLTEVELTFDDQDEPLLYTLDAFCSCIIDEPDNRIWQSCCHACLIYLDNNHQETMAKAYED